VRDVGQVVGGPDECAAVVNRNANGVGETQALLVLSLAWHMVGRPERDDQRESIRGILML